MSEINILLFQKFSSRLLNKGVAVAAYKDMAGAGRPPSPQLLAMHGAKSLLLPYHHS